MLVALQLVGVAVTPLKLTVLAPMRRAKIGARIVTDWPTGPEVGERLVMLGTVTVKFTALLAVPPTVTTTFPVVAPLRHRNHDACRTPTRRLRRHSVEADRARAHRRAEAGARVVTDWPTGPEVGNRLVMLGTVTVKLTPLLAVPPTVTTTLPSSLRSEPGPRCSSHSNWSASPPPR